MALVNAVENPRELLLLIIARDDLVGSLSGSSTPLSAKTLAVGAASSKRSSYLAHRSRRYQRNYECTGLYLYEGFIVGSGSPGNPFGLNWLFRQ